MMPVVMEHAASCQYRSCGLSSPVRTIMFATFWASLTSREVNSRTSASGLKRELLDSSTGENLKQTCPHVLRNPAVLAQFSPLMSYTTADSSHASSVGITRPTPLPDRVGANASTCSGPLCRRYLTRLVPFGFQRPI